MRSVGEFIKEWFQEWWGLMGCGAFTFLGIYVAAANRSNAWVVGSSAALGSVLVFVASYRAWERQNTARILAETELKAFVDALKGPEVWLSFQTSNLYTGFTVENRSRDVDAIKVSFDPLETKGYRLECEVLPHLRHGVGLQPLKTKMTLKNDGATFLAFDLKDVLSDACASYHCSLNFTLRYSDPRGHRSKRMVAVSANQVALNMALPPEILNHEIEPDRSAGESNFDC
jgi:hypothetical protein